MAPMARRAAPTDRSLSPASGRATDPPPSQSRRILSTIASGFLPGLGQAINRRRRLAMWMLIPSLIVLLIVAALLALVPPLRLAAAAIAPGTLQLLLILDLLVLAWRLLSVGQAFFDPVHGRRPSRVSIAVLAIVVLLVAAPHALAWSWGSAAQSAFGKIFQPATQGGLPVAPHPALDERVNVLVIGVDKTPNRTASLTDSMMVVSLDPVGHTVSMVSLPRDLVNVPLGDGNVFAPKLNSLVSYADRHRDQFPEGGVAALQRAIGALLGIDIHYYARIDMVGFVKVVDAVGGVDIDVKVRLDDPRYDGYGLGHKGYQIEPGHYHMNGYEALAYARTRQGVGDSDFKRADRQQQVLVALRARATEAGSLLFRLPGLLDALGDLVETNVPIDRLPDLAAAVDEVGPGAITRMVVQHPLVKGGRNQYGSVQIPDLKAIRAVIKGLIGPPGVEPIPWPTPKPSAKPKPSASP
jgi:LCP family protein required for cell wall assembly